MERFENWMSYSYDGVEYGRKQVDTKEFTINYNEKISKKFCQNHLTQGRNSATIVLLGQKCFNR